jgi:hypothetical protein
MHAFLSIQLLLSVFFHSAVVCHPIFCYAADACHFTFCLATVTFPFVIQLLVTSSSSHPAAFHTSVINMFVISLPSVIQLLVTSSFCHSAACHLFLLSFSCLLPLNYVTDPPVLFFQSMRRCLSFQDSFLRLSAIARILLVIRVPVTFPFASQKPVTPLSVPFCLSARFLISWPFVSAL